MELVLSGAGVDLDNNIIEMCKDPSWHLLVNAIDHGLEEPSRPRFAGKKKTGTLSITSKTGRAGTSLCHCRRRWNGLDGELVKETAIRKGLLHPTRLTGCRTRQFGRALS